MTQHEAAEHLRHHHAAVLTDQARAQFASLLATSVFEIREVKDAFVAVICQDGCLVSLPAACFRAPDCGPEVSPNVTC